MPGIELAHVHPTAEVAVDVEIVLTEVVAPQDEKNEIYSSRV